MKQKLIKCSSIMLISIFLFIFICFYLEAYFSTPSNINKIYSSNFGTFISITIGAIVIGSFSSYIIVKKYKKEQRIKTILKKVLDTASTFCISSLSTEEYSSHPDNPNAIVESCPPMYETRTSESSIEKLAESNETIETIQGINWSQINFVKLFKIFWKFNKAFPQVKQKYPEIENLNFLMDLKSLPEEEIFAFISALLEIISIIEVQTQISIIINELKDSQIHEHWRPLLYKIEGLIYLGASLGDHRLLTDLIPILIFIKYSPEIQFESPLESHITFQPQIPIQPSAPILVEIRKQTPVDIPEYSH